MGFGQIGSANIGLPRHIERGLDLDRDLGGDHAFCLHGFDDGSSTAKREKKLESAFERAGIFPVLRAKFRV